MNGIPDRCIFTHSNLELPGFYRPNKKWDLLVINKKKLIAAIEFKSQVGPSFGNNFNNRTEEAMGSALDLWTAFREGVFGLQNPPWLGYLMLLEECAESVRPVTVRSPHFAVLDEFSNASYEDRYAVFCSKLLTERQYNSVCFMTTKAIPKVQFNYPKEELSLRNFLLSMLGSTATYFAT